MLAPRRASMTAEFHPDYDPRGFHICAIFSRDGTDKRFRRRDQDVRRRAEHGGPFALRRVAAAHCSRDPHGRTTHFLSEPPDFAARLRQILVDVGRERFQRRDVDDAYFVGQLSARPAFAEELVYRREERREGLAGARWRSDQRGLRLCVSLSSLELGFSRSEHMTSAGSGRRLRADITGERRLLAGARGERRLLAVVFFGPQKRFPTSAGGQDENRGAARLI